MKSFNIKIKGFQFKEVLLDDEDYKRVTEHKWRVSTSGPIRGNIGYKGISLANFIMNNFDPNVIYDHKDRNPFNNQKNNFRICDHQQNIFNTGPKSDKKFKGVTFDKGNKKWRAQIMDTYKNYYIGCYNTPEEAARAYDKEAIKRFGEFAYINFPGGI